MTQAEREGTGPTQGDGEWDVMMPKSKVARHADRGRQASVIKWHHGSSEATEVQFDLFKDSLPALRTRTIPFTDLPKRADLHIPAGCVPPEASHLVSLALQALA